MPDQLPITTLSGTPSTVLGLGAQPEQDPEIVPRAHEAGINYFFCYSLRPRGFIEELAQIARANREEIILSTGTFLRPRPGRN